MRDTIIHGDALAVLKTLADNSIDALCTDPPSGIHFMSASWDHDKGGRQQWIAWLQEIMAEALRCCKPGAHALVWALPRTSHWTATALEDAGWQIRDVITSITGQGFPKSLAIDKAIDKQLGAERRMVGYGDVRRASHSQPYGQGAVQDEEIDQRIITAPATPEAQQWAGFGSSLKPASEHWILCRKPLAAANLASNVLAWGTGGLNIAASRVQTDEDRSRPPRTPNAIYGGGKGTNLSASISNQAGRWPPNFLLSHADLCTPDACAEECPVRLLDEQAGERKSGAISPHHIRATSKTLNAYGERRAPPEEYPASEGPVSRFFPVFTPDMPVAYFPKASRRERNAGCEGLPEGANRINAPRVSEGENFSPSLNHHPCVKSLALCSWLVRLITPPGGTVLDCFAGSGSTLVACVQEGFHFLGIEQDASYVEIARARIAHAVRNAPVTRQEAQQTALPAKVIPMPRRKKNAVSELQLSLFA